MIQTMHRAIPGYADLYAGMDGSIVSGAKGRALKQTRRRDGYLLVHIPNIKQELVHRLVAAAFLGPCPPGMQVRHGDGTRDNNQIGNLCYGSPRDNTQDAMRDGTHQGVAMSAKTECTAGHPYSPENTYIHPTTGSRHCRACRTAYLKEYRKEYDVRPENRARKAALYQARKAQRAQGIRG